MTWDSGGQGRLPFETVKAGIVLATTAAPLALLEMPVELPSGPCCLAATPSLSYRILTNCNNSPSIACRAYRSRRPCQQRLPTPLGLTAPVRVAKTGVVLLLLLLMASLHFDSRVLQKSKQHHDGSGSVGMWLGFRVWEFIP